MSVVVRGAKNAFRNWLRTGAVVLILAIGIGLSLSMLVAKQAVEARINDLKTQVGTTLTVHPAGSQGFQGGGEPLKQADVDAVKTVAHVTSAEASVNFMMQTEGGDEGGFMIGGQAGATIGKTSLKSGIDPGTLGKRFSGRVGDGAGAPPEVHLPIRGVGTNSGVNAQGQKLKITEGRTLKSDDTYSALVGKELAIKNDLHIGSTFTAYEKTFTVVGIFDQGTQFENDTIAIPVATAQELSGQTGEVSVITVTVDSIDNLSATSDAIKAKLGASKADVTSPEQNIQTAIESLGSVQQVTLVGFIAALAAAAVIIFLIMLVIVRERKREIGVLKAIGGSNFSIVSQFMVEALVLVAMGAVIGLGVALVSSGSIANALVKNSSSSEQTGMPKLEGPSTGNQPRAIRLEGNSIQSTTQLVGQVTASVGPITLLWGVIVTVIIAIVGSAVPAWLIAKVRPAIVLRGE